MEIDEDWLKQVLIDDDSSNSEGICEVLEIKVGSGVGKNENVGSEILKVDVNVKLHSGKTELLSFIYKCKRKGLTQEFLEEANVFGIETLVYGKYLKIMTKLNYKYHETDETPWPVCLAYLPDVILLENLKSSGFTTLQERRRGMDWYQSVLVIKSLAKFHALSARMLQEGSLDPADFGPSLFHRNTNIVNNLYIQGVTALADSIVSYWGPGWESTADKIRLSVADIGIKLKEMGEATRGQFDVLNHGDCWTNNVMFKFEGSNKSPSAMMFIDFQLCHVNSYAWDLTYFLYNCLLPDFRRNNIGKLLDVYSETLLELCMLYELNSEIPFRKEVHEAMDQIQYYGLIISCCTIPLLMSCDKADFEFDIEELASDSPSSVYPSLCYSDESFIDIMKRELEYFTSINII